MAYISIVKFSHSKLLNLLKNSTKLISFIIEDVKIKLSSVNVISLIDLIIERKIKVVINFFLPY